MNGFVRWGDGGRDGRGGEGESWGGGGGGGGEADMMSRCRSACIKEGFAWLFVRCVMSGR